MRCFGRLCARGAPSAKKVREWKEAGATAVVTLLRSDENQIGPIEAACTGQELVWLHLPLSGKKAVPSSTTALHLPSLSLLLSLQPADTLHTIGVLKKLQVASEQSQRSDFDNRSLSRAVEVAELLQQGASVIVHCAAGMHRTGVMCYLAQRYAGLPTPNPDPSLCPNCNPNALRRQRTVIIMQPLIQAVWSLILN